MIHHDRMINLFGRALNAGARRLSISALQWDISGKCHQPYWTEIVARPPPDDGRYFRFVGKAMTMRIDLGTPCRKCEACRKARSFLWRIRATEELQRAARTWFGTLTMDPESHYRMMASARYTAHTRGVRWADLTDDERFRRVADTSLKEVTKYVKRIRKQSGVPLRTLCVTEKHKSGLPHFHMLVHEVELKPVTHKILSTQWSFGFERWRLVDFDTDPKKSARYICKYLTKDAQTRIRASLHYGKSISTVGGVLTSIKDYDLRS